MVLSLQLTIPLITKLSEHEHSSRHLSPYNNLRNRQLLLYAHCGKDGNPIFDDKCQIIDRILILDEVIVCRHFLRLRYSRIMKGYLQASTEKRNYDPEVIAMVGWDAVLSLYNI